MIEKQSFSCSKGNVLLIDDEELIQTSMHGLLCALGYNTITTGSGEDALTLLDGGLKPDLIILDMNMPGLGGAGTLPILRKKLPTTLVLLATGQVDQSVADLASSFQKVKVLPKPFSIKDIQQHLN